MRLVLFFTVLVCKGIFAQPINLVPNPSFEIYDTCPPQLTPEGVSGLEAICNAIPWYQPNHPELYCSGSTDYYNICSNAVPSNYNGYQYARTGFAYASAGVFNCVSPFGGREYFQVLLIERLKTKKYCSFFFVSSSEKQRSATSCIELVFTEDTLKQLNEPMFYAPIIIQSSISSKQIISDTINWTLIKGIYKAHGNEQFMTVGCFKPYENVEFICPDNDPFQCGWTYYYFDDFGVYELPEISAGLGGEIDTLGENVALQANCEGCWNDLVYRWWPSAGLSDTTILNPIATPEVTTTYYFGLIDTSETVPCIVDLVDSVTVFVTIPQDTVTPPPTFFSWLVYPSPTSGNLTLQFSALTNDSQLLIIDARGRLVRKIFVPKNTESMPLDISALAAGEYFLQVENEGLKEKRKIVKF
jgi:hypothetical protein